MLLTPHYPHTGRNCAMLLTPHYPHTGRNHAMLLTSHYPHTGRNHVMLLAPHYPHTGRNHAMLLTPHYPRSGRNHLMLLTSHYPHTVRNHVMLLTPYYPHTVGNHVLLLTPHYQQYPRECWRVAPGEIRHTKQSLHPLPAPKPSSSTSSILSAKTMDHLLLSLRHTSALNIVQNPANKSAPTLFAHTLSTCSYANISTHGYDQIQQQQLAKSNSSPTPLIYKIENKCCRSDSFQHLQTILL